MELVQDEPLKGPLPLDEALRIPEPETTRFRTGWPSVFLNNQYTH